jgi:hypothetical protein
MNLIVPTISISTVTFAQETADCQMTDRTRPHIVDDLKHHVM